MLILKKKIRDLLDKKLKNCLHMNLLLITLKHLNKKMKFKNIVEERKKEKNQKKLKNKTKNKFNLIIKIYSKKKV